MKFAGKWMNDRCFFYKSDPFGFLIDCRRLLPQNAYNSMTEQNPFIIDFGPLFSLESLFLC